MCLKFCVEMQTFKMLVIIISGAFLLAIFSSRVVCVPYVSCPFKSKQETRRLNVLTCDTRNGWKEFVYMKPWNLTGNALRTQGVSMSNVCKGENWGKYGFLTKPLIYLSNLNRMMRETPVYSDLHVILMDSDTFWSVNDIKKVWNKYDCARGEKNLLISTEMSCWIGRYCNATDLLRWYSNPKVTPSYSPFANSGIIMGGVKEVANMLEYVITNNHSYWTHYGRKYKFDDQYAIADYAIKVRPDLVALDYHQQVSASFSIHASPIPMDEGWPFVCKNRTGELSPSCPIFTNLVNKHGHFQMDKITCLIYRSTKGDMPYKEELETLAPDPLMWHGNGKKKERISMNV